MPDVTVKIGDGVTRRAVNASFYEYGDPMRQRRDLDSSDGTVLLASLGFDLATVRRFGSLPAELLREDIRTRQAMGQSPTSIAYAWTHGEEPGRIFLFDTETPRLLDPTRQRVMVFQGGRGAFDREISPEAVRLLGDWMTALDQNVTALSLSGALEAAERWLIDQPEKTKRGR